MWEFFVSERTYFVEDLTFHALFVIKHYHVLHSKLNFLSHHYMILFKGHNLSIHMIPLKLILLIVTMPYQVHQNHKKQIHDFSLQRMSIRKTKTNQSTKVTTKSQQKNTGIMQVLLRNSHTISTEILVTITAYI